MRAWMRGTTGTAGLAAALALGAALAIASASPVAAAGGVADPGSGATGAAASPAIQGGTGRGAAADSLRVFLLTFGPGSEVWERFGHNALWIHDPSAGTDIAYHYGLFDMSESGFMTRFLQGRMFYYMGNASALRLLDAYHRAGREATVQELALTAEQARSLQSFLEWNLRPENRGYRYDYFRDNCSTRVRDALDDALGGQLATALEAEPTPITYRSEALSLTAADPLLTVGMDIGLGPLADKPITRWDLAYIPMRLRDDVRSLTIRRDGGPIPLVVEERMIPPPGGEASAPAAGSGRLDSRILWMLLAGVLTGAVIGGLGWLSRRGEPRRAGAGVARGALAIVGSLWGLVAGLLGLVLLALWLFTDHEFAHRNENLLQLDPLALALVVLVPLAVAGRARRVARWVAGALLGLSVLGLALHPLPVTPQANLGVIALALPVHLAVLYAVWRQGPD